MNWEAAVVVNYASSQAGADAVVSAIVGAGGKAIAVRGDVSRGDEARGVVDAAVAAFGRLDILVNNSGVYEFASIEDVTEEHFHRQFNVNVLGTLLVTQAAVGHIGAGGSIINIGSVVSRITPPNSVVYNGTKGAVDAMTGTLARELGPRQIRVNAINPGLVETEGTRSANVVGSVLVLRPSCCGAGAGLCLGLCPAHKKTAPKGGFPRVPLAEPSRSLEIDRGLLAIAASLDFIRNLLALVEGGHASALKSGDVDEYVRSAVLGLDEAEAFGGVEPFYGACCHNEAPLL